MATPIDCPHCQNPIAIQDPRPGRFRIKCPKCGSPFELDVPEGSGASPSVMVLEPVPTVAALVKAVDPNETVTQEFPAARVPVIPRPPLEDEGTIEDDRPAASDLDPPFQPPRSLGGYRVGRPIDRVRAGLAFEAKRRATGRGLALSVVKPRWAALAAFVARFAREAYATRQLNHPNLIKPLDFDVVDGFALVASDALDGTPLSDPKGREGLDRTGRAAAILHAARALKHAHEQGIYHRDVSLAKIRVDRSGLVRLADLGVGLTPDTPEVLAVAPIPLAGPTGPTPGPAPDSPTASFVRDDIAGLGRALQSLIGGHLGDRATTPGLAAIVRQMMGSGPEPGFTDTGALVRSLEAELGVGGVFTPREEEAAEFEACVRAFEEPPLAKVRPKLVLGSVAALGLFVVIALLAGRPFMALGAIGFGVIQATTLMVLKGTFGRDPLFVRVREFLLGGERGNAITAVVVAVVLVAVLAATGLLGLWVFLGLVAVGLAVAYHFAIDRPIEQSRVESVGRAIVLIRGFRRLGVFEDSVRRFACRQGGPRWEELFEALFGYEALRFARKRWEANVGGKRRARFAPWRDPIIDAIDRRIEARDRARDLVLFQAIEERGLEARGVNLMTARRKGRRIAEAIVLFARQFRGLEDTAYGIPLMDALNRVAQRPDDFLTTAESESVEGDGPPAWREALGSATRILFGPRARFLLGGVLLAGCLLWLHQNDLMISADEIREAGANATNDPENAIEKAKNLGQKFAGNIQDVANAKATKKLEVRGLSPEVTRRLDGFGLGAAGLILILSSFFQGTRFAIFAVPGALVAALGPHLIEPGARPLGPTSLMALAIGGGLFALGVVFGRTRD